MGDIRILRKDGVSQRFERMNEKLVLDGNTQEKTSEVVLK